MKTKQTFIRLSTPFLAAACLAALAHTSSAAEPGPLEIIPDADMRIGKLRPSDGPVSNTGLSPLMGVYRGFQRSLLLFNLSEIPKNAKIQNATLVLTVGFMANPLEADYTPPNQGGYSMGVFRITKPWDELSAHWFDATAGTPWTSPGGDAVGTTGEPLGEPGEQIWEPYAENYDTGEQTEGELAEGTPPKLSWDVTNLVTEWVTGKSPNYGLMVVTQDRNFNRLHFRTKEDTDGYPPILKIELAK